MRKPPIDVEVYKDLRSATEKTIQELKRTLNRSVRVAKKLEKKSK